MVKVRVHIEPTVINWVIGAIAHDKVPSDVVATLEKWREGTVQPTFSQVEDLSNRIHIPFGYFFLNSPPKEELPILEYRTVDSSKAEIPSRELVDTIHYAENIQHWMRNHVISSGMPKLHFVGTGKNIHSTIEFADRFRKDIDLKTDWYSDCANAANCFTYLRKRLGDIGILILMNGIVGNNTHRKLDIDEFRAFTLIDDYAPLIFLNGNDSDGARLFSLVHEAVHIWLGVASFYHERDDNATSTSDVEQFCNAVTAEILVPNHIFRDKWNKCGQELAKVDIVEKLAIFFRCSGTVIARRAKDNNYINAVQYQEIAALAINSYNKQKEKQKGGGGDFYRTSISRLDPRFLFALDNSIKEGKTQYTDAYRLTNLNRTSFDKILERVKGISQ
ncbi:MAG: ImmA/IrrE family metallo-endopeptidase [Methanomicrobiales archaeon]|jgi:Zn-dependent peptidase ImmA (M78 family)|nr:ImmA/IrrE family metallo-endopeptidase [Methanomicrobiales archaeon]